MPRPSNLALMRLSKRAESQDKTTLVETFVDVGPLLTLLSRVDHQIVYGRRGTGKTHALTYLAEQRREAGDCVVSLDLRTIGSTGGMYNDGNLPLAERATRLLADTLVELHSGLREFFTKNAESLNLATAAPILDQLAQAATQVQVTGVIEQEASQKDSTQIGRSTGASFVASPDAPALSMKLEEEQKASHESSLKRVAKGNLRHRVHFGAVGKSLERISAMLNNRRVWFLLDEWSSVPLDLQPILGDLLRRSVFPVPNTTVKIAAIEQRSHFQIPGSRGDYVGIELGADAAADLNFDDFMVFEHDAVRAKQFFQELLFKHVSALDVLRSQSHDVDRIPRNT